jgi:DNA (cytosine-5)-methyltransferase 1
MNKLRVLDLFSGIGGFSIGLERTGGFETVAFCEIEPFPRRVLAKHWPGVPCYHDVRELTAERLAADGIGVDAICGGFPCQDISLAGKGAGMDGERSGLWSEYARLIGELRPRYVIVENVAALLGRGKVSRGAMAEIDPATDWTTRYRSRRGVDL